MKESFDFTILMLDELESYLQNYDDPLAQIDASQQNISTSVPYSLVSRTMNLNPLVLQTKGRAKIDHKDKRDSPHAFKEVTFFYGALACPDHVKPYYPNRVVRQFNREQGIPTKRLLTKVSNLWDAKEPRKFSPKYERVDCFSIQKWKKFILKKADRGRRASECDLLKETIEQMKGEIKLKRVVDEQCALEFTFAVRCEGKILEYKSLEKKNASLEAELRQKSGLEDCNQSLSVELNKKYKEIKSLKAINTILMEQIDMQLPPATPLVVLQLHQPVPGATLAKKYEDFFVAHEDAKKKLIAKEDFVCYLK
ncbi:hypothetical protein GIB67_039497 [Kingdonia uniflora]|uniref:Uncharacterized protein n=1 Tax=Kingdonia uniflora TaxID=39325 RepID=A0A7J7LIR9_9MAGN|nr:hypothetical protein GIB67_039497 [Kingdonia uniflora]